MTPTEFIEHFRYNINVASCQWDGCNRRAQTRGLCNTCWMNKRLQANVSGTTDTQDFWANVSYERIGDSVCWVWVGKVYGFYGKWKRFVAHRVSYEQLVGPIPEGMVLDHKCLNQRCVNPAHLEPVTSGENVMRAARYAADGVFPMSVPWRRG